jgi:hypothetical protein
VNRWGEFSPNGGLFTLASFLKNYRNGPQCWATFYQRVDDVRINFDKKMGWATFWLVEKNRLVTLLGQKHSKSG